MISGKVRTRMVYTQLVEFKNEVRVDSLCKNAVDADIKYRNHQRDVRHARVANGFRLFIRRTIRRPTETRHQEGPDGLNGPESTL